VTRTILHVASPMNGGVPRYVAGLVRDQVARGWTVAVATPSGGDLAAIAERIGASYLPWKAARGPGPAVLGEAMRLARIVDDVNPDVVHLHSSKAGLAGRLALRGTRPTVFTPNAWSFEAVSGPVRSATLAWERYAARWADVIVCVSEAERSRGAEHIDANWRVVTTGVPLSAFPEGTEKDRRAARRRLGLGAAPLVVCVGRLCRQKGQDVLLGAWRTLVDQVPGAELVFVGEGPALARLERLAPPNSGITFAGARTDVTDWLTAANVVAAPSRWEGMSIVMLEAMACGRSLVMTDVDGAREAIDGNGAIVPVEDVDALTRALAERLLDRARTAAEGREGRRRAETFHDLQSTADAVADVYADVLRARTAPAPTGELAAPVP
jgi:glycosyltransferase involved in cell wall biosynthesis